MAVVYPNAVKIARMAAVVSQAGATAVLEIGNAGMATVLATINLGNPIAGAATGAGVLTLSGFPRSDTAADATGTAAAARIRTAPGGTDIITGLTVTATGGGGDITLDSLSITAGQTVTINSVTITHA
jgi:hypothetical protein